MIVGIFKMFQSFILLFGKIEAALDDECQILLLHSIISPLSVLSRQEQSQYRIRKLWLPIILKQQLEKRFQVIRFLPASQRGQLIKQRYYTAKLDRL